MVTRNGPRGFAEPANTITSRGENRRATSATPSYQIVIAGHVDRITGLVDSQSKSYDLTTDWLKTRGTVTCRRRRNMESLPRSGFNGHGFSRREPCHPLTESRCACSCRTPGFSASQEHTSGAIQIIEVLIMADLREIACANLVRS